MGIDFKVYAPATLFEKGNAPKGQRRRIAGIVSTDIRDKHGETLLQDGLDFTPALSHGWYNDNHAKETTGAVGYPEQVQKFRKGDRLPDGTTASCNGTWAEGYLLDTPRARDLWEFGMALKRAGNARRLGFSLEGGITARTGADRKTITNAVVRNIAITNCPVGYETRLECLAKAMTAVRDGAELTPDLVKALTATTGNAAPAGTNPSSQGPTTGEGAGRILTPQSLEHDEDEDEDDEEDDDDLSKAEIVGRLLAEFPGMNVPTAERAYAAIQKLAAHGAL